MGRGQHKKAAREGGRRGRVGFAYFAAATASALWPSTCRAGMGNAAGRLATPTADADSAGTADSGQRTVDCDCDWVGLAAFNQSNAIRVDNMSQMRAAGGARQTLARQKKQPGLQHVTTCYTLMII